MDIAFIESELANDRFAGFDIDGILRGKVMDKEKFLSCVRGGGFGFCSVVFGWDMHDKPYEKVAFSSSDNGFSDILASVDIRTFRRIPWENNIAFFLIDFRTITGEPLEICPRTLLKKICQDTLTHTNGHATAGVELEWFNFKETPQSLEKKNYMNLECLTPGMFGYSLLRPTLNQDYFYDIYNLCADFGIPIEAIHTETGPGVYEAALKYGNAVELADRGQLFKTCQLQPKLHPGAEPIYPSFMAKPDSNLPGNSILMKGCGGHVHLSLISEGINLFWDPNDKYGMSDLFKHFIAGILHCLPFVMPMVYILVSSKYAPNVNSYKRLVANYWAPVMVCWGVENRTASLRVITPKTTGALACSAMGTRVTGCDMNVHLALAAVFASGLYGIRNELPLCPPLLDDVLKHDFPRLPKTLEEATNAMDCKIARELFGDLFVTHYVATRREEWKQWSTSVTQWETKRYFETT